MPKKGGLRWSGALGVCGQWVGVCVRVGGGAGKANFESEQITALCGLSKPGGVMKAGGGNEMQQQHPFTKKESFVI